MPTSGYSFAETEISVRFRAPYITSAINQQYRGILSVGVYEGFNPSPSVNPLGVDLGVASSGRSSAVISSLLEPSTHVTVHLDNVLEVDLTSFASKTVALAIDASYAFPSETTATVNIYDLSMETPPATACVLAEVVVPASGIIPAANITLNNRTLPWDTRGRDATPLISAIRNGEPLLAPSAAGMPDFWEQDDAATEVVFDSSDAETAPSGFDLSFRARKVASGSAAVSGALVQSIGLPIPGNRRVRLSAAYWPVVAPTSGNPTILAVISDFAGVLVTTVELELTSTSLGGWETYEQFSTLPATDASPVVLKELRIVLDGVSYTTGSALAPLFYLSALDVQVEQTGTATDVLASMSGESHHTKARVYEGPYPGAANVALTFSQSNPGEYETLLEPTVFPPSHTFRVSGNSLIDQNLTVLGSANIGLVFGNSLDTAAPPPALALDLGPVNATAVNISKAGAQTRVKGTLRVDQAVTIGGSLDTITATTMEIGASNATEIRISKIGVNTVVEGNLIVEGTTFSTETETVLIKDNYVYLNNGWTPASFRSGGVVVNYLPTATATTVAGAYTTTTVETAGSATFAPADLIQISGSDKNDGLYVVLSHVGTTVTIVTSAGSYFQTAFTAGASDGAAITKVNVSMARVRSDGRWEIGFGSTFTSVDSSVNMIATRRVGSAGTGEAAFFNGDVLESSGNIQFVSTTSSLLLGPTSKRVELSQDTMSLSFSTDTASAALTHDISTSPSYVTLDVDAVRILTVGDSAVGINHTPTNVTLPLRVQQAGFNDTGIEFQRLAADDFGIGSYNRATSSPTTMTLYASNFAWDVASADAMSLTSGGALLIGTTTNPDTAKLHVSGGSITHTSSQFNVRPGASTNYEWVNRSTFGGHTWYVHAGTKQAMTIRGDGSNLGQVGIGTDVPTSRLEVLADGGGERTVGVFRTTDTNVSNQLAFRNGSNSSFGVIGTVSGTGVAGNDVYGLGHALNPVTTDFTPVLNWRSTGTVGINATPNSSTTQILCIQQAGENNVGLTVSRVATSPIPSMKVTSFDNTSVFYRPLILDASEIHFQVAGTTRTLQTSDALVVGGDDGVNPMPDGNIRSPNWENTGSQPANTAGSSLTISSGRSTGSAAGGDIVLAVASAGSSGTGINSQTARVTVGGSTTSIVNPTISVQSALPAADSTLNLAAHAATAGTKTVNVGTGSTGGATVINIGSSTATTTINGSLSCSGITRATGDILIQATAGSSILRGGEAASDAVWIDASNAAGGIKVTNGTGDFTLTSGENITLNGPTAISSAIDIGSQANASGQTKTITIGNNGVAGSTTSINIASTVPGTSSLTIGTTTSTTSLNGTTVSIVGPSTTGAASTLNLFNQAHPSGNMTINVGSGAHGGGTKTINIGNDDGAGTGGTVVVNIATNNGEQSNNAVNIGTDPSDALNVRSEARFGAYDPSLIAPGTAIFAPQVGGSTETVAGYSLATRTSMSAASQPRKLLGAKGASFYDSGLTQDITLAITRNGEAAMGAGIVLVNGYVYSGAFTGGSFSFVLSYTFACNASGAFLGGVDRERSTLNPPAATPLPTITHNLTTSVFGTSLLVNLTLDFSTFLAPSRFGLSVLLDHMTTTFE